MSGKYSFALPEDVEFIIKKFNENGYRADIVGGCVRDFLLGTAPHDYDLTTDATPEEMKRVLKGLRLIETGIKHGTLTLMLDGASYEITTYRIDGEYSDNRHPNSVTFSRKIEDDLSRRDFTMNAIAYNPHDGLTDPFGGVRDIEKRVIRAVGDPNLRFSEDALRILRSIRFSSVLGFDIDNDTSKAAEAKRELLKNVSAERIFVEWKKLLSGKRALSVIKDYASTISVFLPELLDFSKIPEAAFDSMSPEERNIILFYYNSPDTFSSAMKRLKTDKRTGEFGQSVLDCLSSVASGNAVSTLCDAGRLFKAYGDKTALTAIALGCAVGICPSLSSDVAERFAAEKLPYRISDLSIDGNDLITLGINGKEIGKTLDRLLDAVISREVENTKYALVDYLIKSANNLPV